MRRCLLAACLLLLAAAPDASAQSLWKRRAKGTPDPFSDRTASRKGDLLTVMVRINQQISRDDATNTKESSSFRAALEAFGINPATFGDVLPDIKGSSEKKYDGEAKIKRNGIANAQLTARVHSVQPNGNLVVVGSQVVVIDDDKRVLKFQGVVRRADVSRKNTVESSKIANVRMSLRSTGPTHRSTRRGLFARIIHAIIDFIWPF